MAENIKIVLNPEGVRELLKSPEMMAICTELAEGIRTRAGDGYGISQHNGANRVNVSVYTDSAQAAAENRGSRNALLEAVGR